MPQIRRLCKLIKPSNTDKGDGMYTYVLPVFKHTYDCKAISSLILAIDMITRYCKKLKYKRKIVLATDGNGSMDPDGIDGIVNKIKEENIELVVL
jgi:ATP-dependent DNA helicase 2 subunit 2